MTKMLRILGKRGRITIPYEIRQRVGFAYNDVLSFEESADGKAVRVKREKICNNCIADRIPKEKDNEVTLLDYLYELSPEQQVAAFVHLSMKVASVQGGVANG